METYRRIAGYNHYSVSDCGNVRNDSTGRILKPQDGGKGYKKVRLYNGTHNDYTHIAVHRLVALTFQDVCGEYKDGLQVDHINTIKDDNRAENLRWVTPSENRLNPISNERFKESISGKNHFFYGKHHSEESKKKMSDAKKLNPVNYWKGKCLSEEHKNKLSESHKGKHWKLENGIRVWY